MQKHKTHSEGYKYIPLDDYKNYFYTNDFPLSTVLICKDFELATIDHEGSGKYTFIFKSSEEIKTIVDNYWSHKIYVDPLDYENHRKNLKSRMFSLFKK